MSYSVLFLSSDEISNALLSALKKNVNFNILGLVCAPDKPVGRGMDFLVSSTKHLAMEYGIPVFQPERLNKDEALYKKFQAEKPDFLITFAYGQILNDAWLKLARFPALNVHPSLLPKYRGPAPLQGVLLSDDEETGISLIEMVHETDAGPLFAQTTFPLPGSMTLGVLQDLVSEKAASWIPEQMRLIAEGKLQSVPQNDQLATYTHKVTKQDGFLNFQETSKQIIKKFHAFTPWPGLWTTYKSKRLKLLDIEAVDFALAPGEVHLNGKELCIGTRDGSIRVKQVQLEGKQSLHTDQFLIGQPEFTSSTLPS